MLTSTCGSMGMTAYVGIPAKWFVTPTLNLHRFHTAARLATAPAKSVHQRVHLPPLRRLHMHPAIKVAPGTVGNLHRPPGAPIKDLDGSGTPGPVSGRGSDRCCIPPSRRDNTAF